MISPNNNNRKVRITAVSYTHLENGNGLPDDEWYELAGSEYGKDTETRNYEITYYRPQPANGDIRWTDNQGGEGFVYRNSYHQQDSYYPLSLIHI